MSACSLATARFLFFSQTSRRPNILTSVTAGRMYVPPRALEKLLDPTDADREMLRNRPLRLPFEPEHPECRAHPLGHRLECSFDLVQPLPGDQRTFRVRQFLGQGLRIEPGMVARAAAKPRYPSIGRQICRDPVEIRGRLGHGPGSKLV